MKISARPLKGEPFDIEVQPDDTIMAIKAKVAVVKPDMPAEVQKVVFSGRVLSNELTVDGAGLKEGDFIVIMMSKKRKAAAGAASEHVGEVVLAVEDATAVNVQAPAPTQAPSPAPAAPAPAPVVPPPP